MVELIASGCCEAKIINEFKNGLDKFIVKHNDCVQSLAEKEIAQESHWLLEVKRVPWGKSHSLFALFFFVNICYWTVAEKAMACTELWFDLVELLTPIKKKMYQWYCESKANNVKWLFLFFFNILLVNIIALTSLYIVKNTEFFKLASLPLVLHFSNHPDPLSCFWTVKCRMMML